MRARSRLVAWCVVLMAGLFDARLARAEGDEAKGEAERPVDWTKGPARVDVGSNLAEVELGERLVYAGREDTGRLLRSMGNLVDGNELGLVAPAVDGEDWFIIFEWRDVGFVKDDDRDDIDADALLESIREGTEAANEQKEKEGLKGQALHVVGWDEAPHYDSATHHLTWAIRARADDGREVVNYNVRVLGRLGVMSVTLVDAPEGLARAKPRVDEVIRSFRYKRGKTYAEWVPGDKVATYGLTALVAAGAGAAGAKLGLFAWLAKLFAKGGKLVVVFLVGIGAAITKLVKGLFGRRSSSAASAAPTAAAPQAPVQEEAPAPGAAPEAPPPPGPTDPA